MPSVYHSCSIQDEAAEALAQLKQHLGGVYRDFEDQLNIVDALLTDLEGTATSASVTIGPTVDSQIKWTAVTPGRAGNQISITYIYLGPQYEPSIGMLVPRWHYAEVSGNNIRLYLATNTDGLVTLTAYWHLAFWMLNPDVTTLVTGALVGAGGDVPEAQPFVYLASGKDRSVTQVEDAANKAAEPFGYKDYRTFLRSIDVPVLETEADAIKFVQDDGKYIVVNKKLLLVSGTNLVAFNELWRITGQDLTLLRTILANVMHGLPTLVTTQNTVRTTYETVCGVTQPLTTIIEKYRAVNTNVETLKIKFGGEVASFNHYIFWGEAVDPSRSAYERVAKWGLPEEYLGDIFSGVDPEPQPYLEIGTPKILVVEQLDLLTVLKFTDAELTELLNKGVDGVQIPYKVSVEDRTQAIGRMLIKKPVFRPNGMKTSVKSPIAAMQAVDLSKTNGSEDLTKELAVRGRACARSSARLAKVPGFNMPDMPDLPNLPFNKLPDPAKKIESAFGALSSGIAFAERMFDKMLGGIEKTVKGILNKVQNASSFVDNVFNNDLTQCLLGVGTGNTGMPNWSGVGEGLGLGGGNSIPSVQGITGGMSFAMALLKDVFKKMSIELDETITKAFETLMKLIQIPLCVVQKLINSLAGFDLGGLLNACKDGKDLNNNCPAEDTQAVVDASTELTNVLSTIPSLDDLPTTKAMEEVTESVQQFTGTVKKTVTSTTSAVTRGIQQIMDEISQSIDSKLKLVEQLDKAIKDLFGEARDIKENIDENDANSASCLPPALGLFNDAIADYI